MVIHAHADSFSLGLEPQHLHQRPKIYSPDVSWAFDARHLSAGASYWRYTPTLGRCFGPCQVNGDMPTEFQSESNEHGCCSRSRCNCVTASTQQVRIDGGFVNGPARQRHARLQHRRSDATGLIEANMYGGQDRIALIPSIFGSRFSSCMSTPVLPVAWSAGHSRCIATRRLESCAIYGMNENTGIVSGVSRFRSSHCCPGCGCLVEFFALVRSQSWDDRTDGGRAITCHTLNSNAENVARAGPRSTSSEIYDLFLCRVFQDVRAMSQLAAVTVPNCLLHG